MDEGRERDSSSDEGQIIEDEDMYGGLTNGYPRALDDRQKRHRHPVRERKGRCYSDQETPVGGVSTVDCSREETDFRRYGQGWYGDTDFVSHRQVLVRGSA